MSKLELQALFNKQWLQSAPLTQKSRFRKYLSQNKMALFCYYFKKAAALLLLTLLLIATMNSIYNHIWYIQNHRSFTGSSSLIDTAKDCANQFHNNGCDEPFPPPKIEPSLCKTLAQCIAFPVEDLYQQKATNKLKPPGSFVVIDMAGLPNFVLYFFSFMVILYVALWTAWLAEEVELVSVGTRLDTPKWTRKNF